MPRRRPLLPVLAIFFASFATRTAHAQPVTPDTVAHAVPAAPDTAIRAQSAAPDTARHPEWALVLGGGAARGIAHIGVLRALEEEGIRPGLICGTSMGALVGALYATGYSSATIQKMILSTDWDEIFGRKRETFEWRDTTVPQPWLTLIGEGWRLHLPTGMVEDSYLNFTLAEYFLPAEAIAQGDFDRLPIPFRCLGTDAETSNPVVFRGGSLARAVRTSISIPLLFPAVPDTNTLLVDGGMASNLPVSTAHSLGPKRILAIEVSLPPANLTDRSSMFEVSLSIFDRINKRSQQDTMTADDRLIWLDLPHYGPSNFSSADSLIEIGYRECRARVHEFAQLVRHAADSTFRDSVHITLPPARPAMAWLDRRGQESPRAHVAQNLFGTPPATSFDPASLRPSFQDVYRGDMFVSTWPSFRVSNDSTSIAMHVESRPRSEMLFTYGYDNDYHSRVNTSLILRPVNSRLPDKVTLGYTYDPQRKNAFFAFEPHSLARGSNGWFLRGGWRQNDVRLFDDMRRTTETRVERLEAMAGAQKRLMRNYVLQAGAGYGLANTEQQDLNGVVGSVRVQSGSEFGEGIQTAFMVGHESYAAIVARMRYDFTVGGLLLRTSLRAGSSSKETPPDELQSVGGPESFSGIRRREWLGHDRVAAELRLIHSLRTTLRVFAYGHGARITGSISRPDLNGEIHFAAGAGLETDVPFGPLNLDWGINDDGDFRLDVNFGQRF